MAWFPTTVNMYAKQIIWANWIFIISWATTLCFTEIKKEVGNCSAYKQKQNTKKQREEREDNPTWQQDQGCK